MTDFVERKGELLQAIQSAVPAGEQDPPEQNLLNLAAVAWQEHRASGLRKLLELLGDDGPEPIADDGKSAGAEMESDLEGWTDALGSAAASAEWATGLVESTSPAEEHFVSELGEAAKVAEARDFIADYVVRVKDVTEKLTIKWEALKAQRGITKQQEEDAFAKIVDILTKGFEEERSLYDTAKKATLDLAAKVKDRLTDLPEGLTNAAGDVLNAVTGIDLGNTDSVLAAAGMAADSYRHYLAAAKAETDVLETLLNQESGSVIYLFASFREEAQRWVDEFGYEKVEAQEEEASDALSTLVSNVSSSSANQKDAQEFADRARVAIRDRVIAAKAASEGFLKEHNNRFVGPVAEDVRRALWDRDVFDREFAVSDWREVQTEPIEEWATASRDLFDVDFEDVASDALASFKASITERVENFDPEQVKAVQERIEKLIDEADAKRKDLTQ
jgi:hypothetical protein